MIFLKLILGGIIYYLTAKLGVALFSFEPSNITILWLPFAVGVILFYHFGKKVLPFIFLGSFFANFSGMDNGLFSSTFLHTFICSSADTLASFLSVIFIRKYVDEKLDSISGLIPFTLYAAVIPTLISSVIISLNLWWGDYIASKDIVNYIFLLIFADSLGLFLLYPIYKGFTKEIPPKNELKEIFIYVVLIALTVYLSFSFNFLIFIALILIVIMTFKTREDIASIILLVMIIELIALSALDKTLFLKGDINDSILMLMSFIVSLVFIVLGINLYKKDLLTHQYLSFTDTLTQINNRLSYKNTIENYIDEFKNTNHSFTFLIFDIDDFKSINDTYGHIVGDNVLKELAILIKNNIRNSDSFFRVGGEEFIILFPQTTLDESIEIAEKLRILIEENLNVIENKAITVSIGLTEIKKDDTEDSLYKRADNMLYKSKHNGKNMITFDKE